MIRRRAVLRVLAVVVAALAAVTSGAHARGLVATWRGLGSTPVVYGAEGVIVERIDGERQSRDEYSRELHSMSAAQERVPLPFFARASLDSLGRGYFARRFVADLATGSFDTYDKRDLTIRHRTFRPQDVPQPRAADATAASSAADSVITRAVPTADDTSGRFAFVGTDTVAGFPARRYRSRTPQRGFLGFAMPDSIDLHNELVVEVWFAGPAPLLDRYFAERARFPVLTSTADTVNAPDTLVWGDGSELPRPAPVGAVASERGHAIAMEVSYVFSGSAADSIAAAYRTTHARLGVVADLAARRVWLNRTRLLLLREEDILATAFEEPRGYLWKPAP